MIFEWDEEKRNLNREKHDIDFEAVFLFDWENALVADRTRAGEGEPRYAALGIYKRKLHTVIFTKRAGRIRIISFRRSNRTEEKAYDPAKTPRDE